jgi:hypothetical protein
MTTSTTSLALSAAAIAAGGLWLLPEPNDRRRLTLSFPPDLVAEQVEAYLAIVAGLPAGARVYSDVESRGGVLHFYLEAAKRDLATLRAGLHGIAPGIRLSESEDEPADGSPCLRAALGWRGMYVLLKTDQRELAVAGLLGVLRSAREDERLRLRLRLKPLVRPKAPPYSREHDPGLLDRLLTPNPPLPADQLHTIRQQYAGPLLSVRIELVVWATTRARAGALLAQVVAALRARSGARGRFSVRSHPFALPTGTMLAPPELVTLLAWPLAGPDVPGLGYVRDPQRLPDPAIPMRGGRCFGVSTWPGLESRQLHQPLVGSLSHTLILGPTGSGKSSLLSNLLLDDARADRGLLLIDMKGDTALDVLRRIPKFRHRDVVVLDPADPRPVPGLKGIGSGPPELVADLWVGLFKNLFADSWGVRTERYLRLGLQTLALADGAVITELPRVLTDVAFRRGLLARSSDPLLKAAWASFEALSPAQQAEHLQAPLGKVQDIVGRRTLRAVLGQVAPKMTIARAMAERRVVVVRLSPGELGTPTAQLLGALTTFEIYQAVMGRQRLGPEARTPFMVYVDEPAVMGLSGVPLDALYELARGMRVGITTATQSVRQLPTGVQHAVLTNAATIATFRTGHQDAGLMAHELLGVTAEQLQHLGQYEIALRLGLSHGQVSAVATARTLPLPEPSGDAEELRDQAARRWGVSAEQTDAALKERWTGSASSPDETAPVGRRRLR